MAWYLSASLGFFIGSVILFTLLLLSLRYSDHTPIKVIKDSTDKRSPYYLDRRHL